MLFQERGPKSGVGCWLGSFSRIPSETVCLLLDDWNNAAGDARLCGELSRHYQERGSSAADDDHGCVDNGGRPFPGVPALSVTPE